MWTIGDDIAPDTISSADISWLKLSNSSIQIYFKVDKMMCNSI